MTSSRSPITNETTAADPAKGVYFIAASQFGIAFSFNCIMSFMPFYILRLSPYSERETMVWIGVIMGATSFVAALAAPFWGGLTARVRPKLLFQGGIFCNGVLFCLMGFVENLTLILLLRLLQGVLGAVSTIGLVLIAGVARRERLPAYMSLFQNSMTAGQLVGPPLGAYAVALFGYHAPFVIAPVVTFVSLAYCHRHVRDLPVQPPGPKTGKAATPALLWGWALTVVGTIHLMFLPSILPHLLEGFGVTGEGAVSAAGTIMMFYMASAILGNYLLVRLSGRWGVPRLIAVACLAATALQLLLYLSRDVYGFTLVRMLQTAAISAVFPLVVSSFVGSARGATLGFLNSARFVGNAIGPMMATAILAHADVLTLYLAIAGLTLAVWWAFVRSRQ